MIQILTSIPRHDVKVMAEAYDKAPDQIGEITHDERKVFRQLVNQQFADLSKVIYFDFFDFEPYGENPLIKDVLKDFRKGRIHIHTTGNDSRIWGTFTNLQFRAVHDYIHCVQELEFTHTNEVEAYKAQMEFSLQYAKQFPHLNWDVYNGILRSEIVYQSAYKEAFGKFHIDQKIILTDL